MNKCLFKFFNDKSMSIEIWKINYFYQPSLNYALVINHMEYKTEFNYRSLEEVIDVISLFKSIDISKIEKLTLLE